LCGEEGVDRKKNKKPLGKKKEKGLGKGGGKSEGCTGGKGPTVILRGGDPSTKTTQGKNKGRV